MCKYILKIRSPLKPIDNPYFGCFSFSSFLGGVGWEWLEDQLVARFRKASLRAFISIQ